MLYSEEYRTFSGEEIDSQKREIDSQKREIERLRKRNYSCPVRWLEQRERGPYTVMSNI